MVALSMQVGGSLLWSLSIDAAGRVVVALSLSFSSVDTGHICS